MVGKLRIVLVAVVAAVWSLVLVGGSHGAQIELATDAPKPLAPEEGVASEELVDGGQAVLRERI